MVGIGRHPHRRRQIEIRARPHQHRAGTVEIRLALFLRRAQRIEHAVAPVERDRASATGKRDRLADPVTRVGTRKDRVLEDRVEAAFPIVIGIAVAAGVERRQAEAHPVAVIAHFRRTEIGADLRRTAGEETVPVLAERAVSRGGHIDPPDPTIGIIAEIDHIIIAPAQRAEQRGAHREAVGIDLDPTRLAVAVIDGGDLAGETRNQEILAIDVCREHPIVARALHHAVQPRIGVLLQPPEGGEVELEAVAVAIAEQPHAQLLIVEQEAAKVALKRLDADADRHEIVAVGGVAQMVIDERLLHADEAVEPVARLARVDRQHAAFGHIRVIDVEGEAHAIFDLGRLERGRALDQRRADQEGLRDDIARILAEYVEAAGAFARLYADRDREGTRLKHRVADRAHCKEPIVLFDRKPFHLGAIDRAVAL